MNFLELQNQVIALTSRPDKRALTKAFINAAIKEFSLKGEFSEDFVEKSVTIDSSLYGQTIDLSADEDFTNFRRFRYVKLTGVKGYLIPLDPEHVFTPAGQVQTDTYYRSGNSLTIVQSQKASALEVGFYTFPTALEDDEDTCWLSDKLEEAIYLKAAASIFRSIGDDASYKFHEGAAQDLYKIFRSDAFQAHL